MAIASDGDVNFETFDFESAATMSKFINKGANGEIYGPFLWNSKECALKRILINQEKYDAFKKQVNERKNIWTSLKHNNLIKIHHVSFKEMALCIVMEYASGGSLRGLLSNHDIAVHCQRDVSNWAKQIAEGMLFLHENGIVHRDLKSGNIMLMKKYDSENPHKEMTLKITDFDEVKEFDQTATMSCRGTCAYMAPEVLTTQRFSKASEVWSFGVVIWELLTRELPHSGQSIGPLVVKASSGELTLSIPESIPAAYKNLLHECWSHDTKSRPSFKKIMDTLSSIDSREEGCVAVKKTVEQGQTEEKQQIKLRVYQRQEEEHKVYYKDDPVLVKTIRTKAAEENDKAISGLAIADNELFITNFHINDVEVYDLKNLSLTRSWKLDPLINPWDLGYCNINKCLYVMDMTHSNTRKEIYRVDGNGKLLKSWTTNMDGGCISVTYDCNVVMAAQCAHHLIEYTSDGQIVRQITLPAQAGFVDSRHAIKLPSGLYLISHGVGDSPHRVCVVDIAGDILMSFGGPSGSTSDRIDIPIYLAIDSNGSIFVVDCGNGRVLMLSSGLEFMRDIISSKKEGMHRPERMVLDQANGRLLVAHNDEFWSECRVFVFEIL